MEVELAHGCHVRIRRAGWDRDVAHLGTYTDQPLDGELVDAALARLRVEGFRAVTTSALRPAELAPYLARGFGVERELVLLRLGLRSRRALPSSNRRAVRRPTRSERADLTELDGAAFDPFWHLDESGLRDAIGATPKSRLRVSAEKPALGYAISGAAGRTGYLQRLAVHPSARRQGRGRALVADALRWMLRQGADEALVNTQRDNDAALALYRTLGFEEAAETLAIMHLPDLGGPDRT